MSFFRDKAKSHTRLNTHARTTTAPQSNIRVDTRLITKMFDKYKEPDQPDTILIDGTIQLCEDVGIAPTDVDFLVLSYYLRSERMGEFHREPFVQGALQLQCQSIEQLKSKMPQLRASLNDPDTFKAIYNYAFLFGKQAGQKSLSLDAAIELWRLLLSGRFALIEEWIAFLEEKHRKAISRDTWNLFYDFTIQTDFNLDTHDAEGAWPILIDEFVAHMKEKA